MVFIFCFEDAVVDNAVDYCWLSHQGESLSLGGSDLFNSFLRHGEIFDGCIGDGYDKFDTIVVMVDVSTKKEGQLVACP